MNVLAVLRPSKSRPPKPSHQHSCGVSRIQIWSCNSFSASVFLGPCWPHTPAFLTTRQQHYRLPICFAFSSLASWRVAFGCICLDLALLSPALVYLLPLLLEDSSPPFFWLTTTSLFSTFHQLLRSSPHCRPCWGSILPHLTSCVHIRGLQKREGLVGKKWPYVQLAMCCAGLVAQSCPTLCDPVGCSLQGSSVHGIL